MINDTKDIERNLKSIRYAPYYLILSLITGIITSILFPPILSHAAGKIAIGLFFAVVMYYVWGKRDQILQFLGILVLIIINNQHGPMEYHSEAAPPILIVIIHLISLLFSGMYLSITVFRQAYTNRVLKSAESPPEQ